MRVRRVYGPTWSSFRGGTPLTRRGARTSSRSREQLCAFWESGPDGGLSRPKMDRISSLSDGGIVEERSHQALLQVADGCYANLVQQQFTD
jgi:hypothetical protein